VSSASFRSARRSTISPTRFAWATVPIATRSPPSSARTTEGRSSTRSAAARPIAVYAASLGILELAERIGAAGVAKDFQHGHTLVSAFWGVLGLLALYAGLRRGSRTLRLSGFGLFGVSLAKLFLYDLAALSSITRALSFLAVGAVLLLGGFFYQRLSAEFEDRLVP
jgi:uncharacterized membrane protein